MFLISNSGGLSRRYFTLAVASSGLCISGAIAKAGGGIDLTVSGEYNPQYDDEDDGPADEYGYSQSEYLQLSRNQMRDNISVSSAYVVGFSYAGSNHLFRMGYGNRRGTRGVFRALQEYDSVKMRRSYLRDERDDARAVYEAHSGSDAKRQQKQFYYMGVSYWHKHPKEGLLKLKY